MSHRLIIYPYKMSSKSAKLLQDLLKEQGLKCLRVKKEGLYRPQLEDLVINWGSTTIPSWLGRLELCGPMLNSMEAIKLSANKLKTLQKLLIDGLNIPKYTTHLYQAKNWIEQGETIYCRTILTGHSGSGIVIANTVDELVEAPLYTKAIPTHKEYRIHVFNGKVIDVQQKKKRDGVEASPLIRNHANGWVFAREGVIVSDRVKEEAIKAAASLGLDFGACDIAVTRDGVPYILEVNTAPGIEGTTVVNYTNAILEYMNGL